MRATLPVNTVPGVGGGDATGIGDLNVFAAYLFDTDDPGLSFGIGPQITIPTATKDEVGSEKWSLGLANVFFDARSPTLQYGYLLTWQTSVAGSDDRADVNLLAFQPFGFYQLGGGWYLRSTGIWAYNVDNDSYSIPFGLGAGKVIQTERATINAFVEPQISAVTHGDGQPEWNVFGGVNFQF